MTRLAVVAGVLVLVALGTVVHRRWSASLADRSGLVHPEVPGELVGPGRTWLVFSTRLCATCGPVARRLRTQYPQDTVRQVMVEADPELARAFSVRAAPTLLEVDADGRVVHSVGGAEAVLAYVDSLAAAS